jgi:trehalose 6-phosphate synthase/trehalose 6-phosphate phosphatase
MTPEAANTLDQFFVALRGAPRALLLLDYDGTLAPFRVDRFRAKPFSGVTELLRRIQKRGSTRMAVVTGRPAGEIAPLLGLDPPLEVWGLHGAERLFPDGRRELESASPATAEKLDELRAMLRRDSFGGLFEDKANAVVMHWRGVPASRARGIERQTRELFEPAVQMEGMRLLEFEAGVELRFGRDKGGAVEAILEEWGRGGKHAAPVAFLGDDVTDEAAFRAVNAGGAHCLSVLVRGAWRATDANIWLRPPEELRDFLSRWASALEP